MFRRATATVAMPACLLGSQVAKVSSFANVAMGPADPILGLGVAFGKDSDPNKVNLGVGVYRGNDGKPFVLECVKAAEKLAIGQNHEYAPISGLGTFVEKAKGLAFGDCAVLKDKRVASCQSLSGTGALRVAADFMAKHSANKTIMVPNPTWGNHHNIFNDAGLKVEKYFYYDNVKGQIDVPHLLEDLKKATPGTMVLLHACAHNPTGMDPTQEEWKQITQVIKEKELFPFVDMAYQGFASGDTDRDAFALRHLADNCESLLLCQSFAKSFGLYGQRCGAVHIVGGTEEEADKILSQMKILIRPMYSNPPLFGARIVDAILNDAELTAQWKTELTAMSERMNQVRKSLTAELAKIGSVRDWSHIERQIGMMAFTGLTKAQVAELKTKWHLYLTDDGRAAISGLNSTNVEYVAKAFHDVTK